MAFDTSVGKRASKLRQQDRFWEYFCLALLIGAGLILYTINLGSLPLDRLQEATNSQIAQQILAFPNDLRAWIFPAAPNSAIARSPLFPDLLALSYYLGGVSPLTTRLPGALLAALSTGLLYGIGRELFRGSPPALWACCVYVTFFPLIHHGRVATFQGTLLFWEMFSLWAILRSRRDLRWTLITGFGLSLVGLTHSWAIIPVAIVLGLFLAWDTPRLLSCSYFYGGLILGLLPLIIWWLAQWQSLDLTFAQWDYNSSLAVVKSNFAGYFQQIIGWLSLKSFPLYLSGLLYLSSPWLIISVYGLKLAWYCRNWGWAKLILVTTCTYLGFLGFSILMNLVQSEGNSFEVIGLPIYPMLALAAGMQLYQLRNLPSYLNYPLTWSWVFNGCGIAIVLLGFYRKFVLKLNFDWLLLAIFGSSILTLITAAILLYRKDIQFMTVLIWGSYISLLLFFGSQYWIISA